MTEKKTIKRDEVEKYALRGWYIIGDFGEYLTVERSYVAGRGVRELLVDYCAGL